MTPERIAELRAIIAAASLMDEEVNMGIGKAVTQKEFYQSAKLAFPQALDTIEAQQRRIEELAAALKPFANEASEYDQGQFEDRDSPYFNTFNIGQLRTARAALNHKEPS